MHKTYTPIEKFNANKDEQQDYAGIWTYHENDGDSPDLSDIYYNLAICELRNQTKGRYYLIIERSEFMSDDLAELEKHLMDWARSEGYRV